MEIEKNIPRWYLILSIIYSLFQLLFLTILIISSIFSSREATSSLFWLLVLPLIIIGIIWVILNIVMLIVFIKGGKEKIAISLPVLYIIGTIIPYLAPFIDIATLIISIKLLLKNRLTKTAP